ncbi:DUF6273 domain-containing protein [Succinimonas sp.]|uniref:DUF6273 domain-containing protein n=1 Tax=Succinimonas sp. TaxID=1936151 RepID=UPI00386A1111
MRNEQDTLFRLRNPGRNKRAKLSRLISGETPAEKERRPEIQPNTYFMFGHYYYERCMDKAPLEWLALRREGNRVLAVTRYAIDYKRYNDRDIAGWRDCSLRRWLNSDFIAMTFSDTEAKMLRETHCPGTENPGTWDPERDATEDRVFLMSEDEARNWFRGHAVRECFATPYAMFKSKFASQHITQILPAGSCLWFLRQTRTSSCLMAKSAPGKVIVESFGSSNYSCFVRPAMWIHL